LEEHIAQPLKSQAKDDDFRPFPEAKALVQRILVATEDAQNHLATLCKSMGGEARGSFKSAFTALAGATAAMINEARTHAITKKLRDDYTALSLASVSYGLLHATANALAFPEVALFSQRRLHEIAGQIMALSHEITPVAIKELAGTNQVELSTMEESQKNIKAAWTT
jgi:hypothetical protein